MSKKIGSTLVIGGGIAGIQAALDLAQSGIKVHLVERSPSIGGTMPKLDKTFPTNDCSMCILSPKLVDAGRDLNIDLLTLSEVTKIEGEAGNFTVTVKKHPRYVNEDKCVGCGECAAKCPIKVPNEFDFGLSKRKAIYVPFPQAVPLIYAIDPDHCRYLQAGKCGVCAKVCKANAIEYDQKPEEVTLNVGSIIASTGFEPFNPKAKTEYGYGRYKNVVTGLEFERILSASGPYGGEVKRPGDEAHPKKVAFIQCVGSRDKKTNPYCSSVCCMYSTKEAIIAREHDKNIEPTIFFIDMRTYGKEFDDYYNRAQNEYGVRYVRSRVAEIMEKDNGNLILRYIENEQPKEEEFELVVLATALVPSKDFIEFSNVAGISLNKYNFAATTTFAPLETNREGIYVCGVNASPKDIPDTVAQASGAAAKAGNVIASERGTLAKEHEYPAEKNVVGLTPRIGVFICHCGINIGSVVKVPEVVDYAKTLPNVVYADENTYTCSQDTQDKIKKIIKERDLNRVVVAACTPRTHEPLFQSTCREAGLNPYLFEMANIREHCASVHKADRDIATVKAKDLVRMAVAKARLIEPLPENQATIIQKALIIGGGVAGMTAALDLAAQGFDVSLIEKEKELGGNLRRIKHLPDGSDPQAALADMLAKIEANELIHIHTGAEVKRIDGFVGAFKTTIAVGDKEEKIEHGVTVVATGAEEYKPKEYFYGQNDNVVTQLELEERLETGAVPQSAVMIQCVGSRNEESPNCSRVCCTNAIANALKIKEKNPAANVVILYKDIRTYGFKEDFYTKALEAGVMFIRYDDANKPVVEQNEGALTVKIKDETLGGRVITLTPDTLVLSAGIRPHAENEQIGKMLKVPLNKDGFFLEAHMKLRPVDFATEGVFLAGLAHGPKFIEETIAQASATVARAATILSKKSIKGIGTVAKVTRRKCTGCEICINLCPYKAIEKVDGRAQVNAALCKGCGACAGTCPSGAIQQQGFKDMQIISMIETVEDAFTEEGAQS